MRWNYLPKNCENRIACDNTSSIPSAVNLDLFVREETIHSEKIKHSKYHSNKIVEDGYMFDSKKEANHFKDLQLLEKVGAISNLQKQVKYVLIPTQKEKGKKTERACTYYADFVYEKDGKTVVEDVKSPATKTPVYVIKRKLMREKYGIEIQEV